MAKNHRLVIYVDCLERAHFFAQFLPLLRSQGIETLFLTNKLSVKLLFPDSIVLKKHKEIPILSEKIFSKSLSVLNKYHSLDEAKEIGGCVYRLLETLEPDELWIWNGTTTIERAMSLFAKEHDIKRLYFEISNIENRIFVDPFGIAGESLLFYHPEILDSFDVNMEEFYKWRENYLKKKKSVSKKLKSSIPYYAFFDEIGYKLGFLQEDKRDKIKLLLSRLKNKLIDLPLQKPDYSKKYIFVPLQVSNDSQVKIYSKYTNLDLINEAMKIADENTMIYIKPHPAEDNLEEIERVLSTLNDRTLLVNDSLYSLLENAQKIVVNSSTVGLEAMILEKEVVVLGNPYYKHFTFKRLVAFLQHYLPSIKYQGYTPTEEDYKHFNNLNVFAKGVL